MPVQTRPEAKIGPEELAPNAVPSVIAYPPSGGDDSEAVQHAYESLGEPGMVQLKPGHYKFDSGKVKFNKNAVYLRGSGAATMEVESKIVTAGTLITCSSKNKAAIEVSQAGCNFSDFALLNNASETPEAGAYGINSTRVNSKGEETTEGNSRGRYWNIDLEGFFVNFKAIAGFEQRFQGCTFNGGVKYQFQYGDPNNTDAGGLFIDNCSFIVTKKRKVAAYLRWESGGGVFVSNCSLVFNPESKATIPEYGVDFFFEPPAKHGTTNLTVFGCHVEGYENAGVRFFCANNQPEVTLGNMHVLGTEFRPFTAVAGRVGVVAECGSEGRMTGLSITGNVFHTEGGSARIKNVGGLSYSGNTGHVGFTLEGSNAVSGSAGYPSFTLAPTSTTMNVSHAGGAAPYWLLVYPQLKPGELAEYQINSGAVTVGTVKEAAPQPLIYGYCEAIAGGATTEIKCKALTFSIPNGAKIKVTSFENSAIFTEFKTTAEAKVGETKIPVESVSAEIIPAFSPIEAIAPEKYEFVNGPFFFPPNQPYELKRLDSNAYTVKVTKIVAS